MGKSNSIMRTAQPLHMWCAVIKTSAGNEWINHSTIRRLKRDAKEAYLETWLPEYRDKALKNVRFAKVAVSLLQ